MVALVVTNYVHAVYTPAIIVSFHHQRVLKYA